MKSRAAKLLLAAIVLSVFLVFPSFARAGGGGSSGSSGSGGGSSSSGSSYSSSTYRGRSSIGSILNTLSVYGLQILLVGSGTIIFIWKVKKSAFKSRRNMKENVVYGTNWDGKEIQDRVEKAYFEIQECWRLGDPSYASEYLSQECMEDFQMKLGWIDVRNEEIVQENVRLLSAVPVHVHDDDGEERDFVWYLIHGRMVDYRIDKDTRMIVYGNKRSESFYEYWKFICRDGKWVLHEIKQKDEIDIDQFAN